MPSSSMEQLWPAFGTSRLTEGPVAVFDRLPSERHWPAVAGWVALAEVGQCLDSIGRTQLLTAAASGRQK